MAQYHNEIQRLWKSQWSMDYSVDIYNSMMNTELHRRPMYFLSSQRNERQNLLELCKHVAISYSLSRCSLHLAIYYMDRFLDFYKIRPDKLSLLALVCIHLAAQIEGAEASVPRYTEMNSLVADAYAPFEYKAVERKLLIFFDFEIIRLTTANFVEFLSCSFIKPSDYAEYLEADNTENDGYKHFESYEDMFEDLVQLLLHITDYTLNIYRFSNELPSILAAACIGAVRQIGGLARRWTTFLTHLTSYTEDVIQPYIDILTDYHYNQNISIERLNAFIADLEEEENYPTNCAEYQRWSTEDSGFDGSAQSNTLTPPSTLTLTTPSPLTSTSEQSSNVMLLQFSGVPKECQVINIISVQQIRKPNADYQPLAIDDQLQQPNTSLHKNLKRRRTDDHHSENEEPSPKKQCLNRN